MPFNWFKKKSPPEADVMLIITLNARLQPMDRGRHFEDPLELVLHARGLGKLSGAGTGLGQDGEITYCDIEVVTPVRSPEAEQSIIAEMERLGVPKGSYLVWEGDDEKKQFGLMEGLAVYLNGSDLPDETYSQCDINVVIEEFSQLLDGNGRMLSYWSGPTETALYLYGNSYIEMCSRLKPFLDSYPLCERARLVQIA